jgi:methionyl-tRNA synthetase
MEQNKKVKRYTVTSALPYANGPIHIGHLAGVYVPADIYARYLRSRNEDVLFIGGSDEHGVPITIKAKQEGVTPQQIVDKYHNIIKQSFQEFGISFDIYSRTSNKIHHETAAEFFMTLYNKGEFVVKTTDQLYDEENKQFLADRYITGTCPFCNNEKAYGDQCEKCGTSLNATDLINPKSVLSGNVPVMKETKHWYLPLDKYEPWLKQWILEEHKEWKTNVYKQCKSWLDRGLEPRAVTRDLDWGVKVPIEEAAGKVLYVWFDAPIGYISATKEWAEERNRQSSVSSQTSNAVNWELYWKDKETKMVHFIGKDNIVFHCIVFPAMLHAEGSYILPDNVPANEFLNLEGDKISTSRNWAVWLHEYLQEFPGKQDELRYVLCSNAPETSDNNFIWKYDGTPQTTYSYEAKVEKELVANLGNFVNRVMVLSQKFYNGIVPKYNIESELYSPFITNSHYPKRIDEASSYKGFFNSYMFHHLEIIEQLIDNYKFKDALNQIMTIISGQGNFILQINEPWKNFDGDREKIDSVMNATIQIVAILSVICEPFMPFTSWKIRKMLNIDPIKKGDWKNLKEMLKENKCIIEPGHQLNSPIILFEKPNADIIKKQVQKLHDSKIINENIEKSLIPAKPNISYDEFSKMDIRTGTILTAEKVARTQKLLKLTIDTGLDKRTVVSGIAEFYDPENIIGQKVAILVNLEPRTIKGIQSQGMILMAENPKGELVFVMSSKDIENGSTVK